MTEVLPGIYQLPLPIPDNPLGYINTYLVQGNKENLLIDTGWNCNNALDSLEKQLDEIGIGFKDISRVIITHIHPDHYGLAGRLKQCSDATIAMHYLEQDLIHQYIDTDKYLLQLEHWLHINGMPYNEMLDHQAAILEMQAYIMPILPDFTFRGGETISVGSFNFQILWTPGHAPGHICLYEAGKKILFTGDCILPIITPNISLDPQESGDHPLDDYIRSLTTLKQLEADLILPAHQHVFTGLQRRITELIQHHWQRKAEILDILGTNSMTAYQIAPRVTWSAEVVGTNWQRLSRWDKIMAIMETLAHLESMRVEGKINNDSQHNTIYYQPV